MKKLVLLHDGNINEQHATYLALHVAARLGALFKVFLFSSQRDGKPLAQIGAQIETAGRAANVSIEITMLTEFSVGILKKQLRSADGIFASRRLIPDGKTAASFLEAFSCPLWVVADKSELGEIALLIPNPAKEKSLLRNTKTLSRRLQKQLTIFFKADDPLSMTVTELQSANWTPISSTSSRRIRTLVEKYHIGLLFISPANIALLGKMDCTCVIYPKK